MAYQKLQAHRAVEVTPNDSANIPNVGSQAGEPVTSSGACVIYVGTGGSIKVTTAGGDTVTFNNVPGGSFLPVQVVRVFYTGTTAASIIAMW
jgi:hypothetical protein